MDSTAQSTFVVDLAAYAQNLRVVRDMIPKECAIMAVVKGNGYGHGSGADFFAFGEDICGVDTSGACTDDGDAQGAGGLGHERFLSAPGTSKRGDRLRTFVHSWLPVYRWSTG